MVAVVTIIEFVARLGLVLSPAQETLLRAIYGLSLVSDEQRQLFALCTGNRPYREGHRYAETTVIAGARSGKDSRIAGPIMAFEALFGNYPVSKGETLVFPVVAQDLRATRVTFGYIKSYLTSTHELAACVDDEKQTELTLTNGRSILCFPCTAPAMRSFSIPCGMLNELAFFRLSGSADSDVEIQMAMRRGMIAFEHTTLIKISTPYMKSGVLYDDFQRAFGVDDPDLLVWKASSVVMNPTISDARLARERRQDPSRARREYDAEWVDDLSAYLDSQRVEDAIDQDVHERAPLDGVTYFAGADASGGGDDHFTYCIAHKEPDGTVVQDLLRGYGRGQNLEATVKEIAATLRRYRRSTIQADRYAANWVVEAFRREAITLETSKLPDGSILDQSAAYVECEPLFMQGHVRLLDHPKQREWITLEKHARPGGKTQVTHPKGGHDDYAASGARAFVQCTAAMAQRYRIWGGGHDPVREAARAERVRVEAHRILTEDLNREPTTQELEAFLEEARQEGIVS